MSVLQQFHICMKALARFIDLNNIKNTIPSNTCVVMVSQKRWIFNHKHMNDIFFRYKEPILVQHMFTLGSKTKETPTWAIMLVGSKNSGYKDFTLGSESKVQRLKWLECGTISSPNLGGLRLKKILHLIWETKLWVWSNAESTSEVHKGVKSEMWMSIDTSFSFFLEDIMWHLGFKVERHNENCQTYTRIVTASHNVFHMAKRDTWRDGCFDIGIQIWGSFNPYDWSQNGSLGFKGLNRPTS